MTEQTPHQKLHLHPDAFLYAIHQARTARTQAEGSFRSHLRYEPLLLGSWTPPADTSHEALAKELNLVFQHHAQAIPQYRRSETVNPETIAWFAQSFATLFVDLDQVVTGYLGKPLVELLKEDRQVVKDLSEAAKKNLKDYADLFSYYASWCVQSADQTAPIEEVVDWSMRPPCGPLYKAAFKEYEDDRRAERRGGDRDNGRDSGRGGDRRESRGDSRGGDRRESRDNSRGGDRREGQDSRGGERRDNRGPREDHKDTRAPRSESRPAAAHAPLHTSHHEPHHDGHGHAPHHEHHNASHQENHEGRHHRNDAPRGDHGGNRHDDHGGNRQDENRGNRHDDRGGNRSGARHSDRGDHQGGRSGERHGDRSGDRSRHHKKFDDHQSRPQQSPEESQAFLERALYETRKAIARLKEDSGLQEVLLKPQNSFIRREQHVVISDAGFGTESRGEGKERAVCIIRAK